MIRTPHQTAAILPQHWDELQASAIAAEVAAANISSFGPGTDCHWETERSELVRFARLQIQTESTTGRGLPQEQAGHLAPALISLDRRYRHLQAGGWRSTGAALPGLEPFDQWKPNAPRQRRDKPGKGIKYEAPPRFPDGGGLLLPNVPELYWHWICQKQGLPFPADRTAGFWAWALQTPELQLLICEGWKKALAAVSAGYAAVALPGVQMGRRREADDGERLIEALQLLAPERRWLIAFDAEAKPKTARMVGAAAGALARALRAAGGRVEIARLPLLPGTDKTGLDDLLAAAGSEALERALGNVGPCAVLPRQRKANVTAPAGEFLGQTTAIPSAADAPLVALTAPMGCGKTEAISQHLAPAIANGTPVLMPSHRQALGQAMSERVGIPWRPAPGSDERQQGVAACWDSWRPSSALGLAGDGWSGAVVVLDEFAQACEHLLLSDGTALATRRAEVLRTAEEQLSRASQVIGAEASLPDWAVTLLERLTGKTAHVIGSAHQPMAGRPLYAPQGFTSPQAAGHAFRAHWVDAVNRGQSLFVWTSSQGGEFRNSAMTLASLHRQMRPADEVLVIDSTTDTELALELAADPDGWAERRSAAAAERGGVLAVYVTPAISSGLSWARWKPDLVLAYSGGRIGGEHVAQALARVRCPDVPACLFAPERCPGGALKTGSGATDPEQLIGDLRAVADPLYGALATSDGSDAWLKAWAELAAQRNRQRFAYRATIAGLLLQQGWELQAFDAEPCPLAAAEIGAALDQQVALFVAAADAMVQNAEPITASQAKELAKTRRLEPEQKAALKRHRLSESWAIGEQKPSLELIAADRTGLRNELRNGWLLTTPAALNPLEIRDQAAIAALDCLGRPFEPDRLRVTWAPRIAALQALGLPDLIKRFEAGETIPATDPAVVALHAAATTHGAQLMAATGISPSKLATGTLRQLLKAVGWRLERAGRIKTRDEQRDVCCYRAAPVALPEGVDRVALEAKFMAELTGEGRDSCRGTNSPSEPCREKRAPDRPPSLAWALMERQINCQTQKNSLSAVNQTENKRGFGKHCSTR